MDRNIITPEKADEILGYVKKYVVDIETPDIAKKFYIHLSKKFPDLIPLKQKFELEEEEKIEEIFSLLLDEFMARDNIDLANEIMHQIQKADNLELYLKKIEKSYPIELNKALKKLK